MSKRPSDEEIKNRLQMPGPRRKGPQVNEITPPTEEMAIYVSLDQIKPYENNPRKTINPMYDQIKNSIRAVGLNHSPVISKRPNDSKYTVRDGGNTRLQILKELYEETGEERFYKIWCIYRPWESEIRALAGHLSENDNRGQLLFIERALAIVEARKLYSEARTDEISQRELVNLLSQEGYKVHQSNLVIMFQAVEHILPSLPETLYAGMGRDQVVKLLSYRTIYEHIWKTVSESIDGLTLDEFQPAFHNVLAHFDSSESAELPWKLMLDHFLNMLNERTGVHYNILELVIDNLQIYKKRGWTLEDALEPLVNELEDMKNPKPRVYFNGAGQTIPDPNIPSKTEPAEGNALVKASNAESGAQPLQPATVSGSKNHEVAEHAEHSSKNTSRAPSDMHAPNNDAQRVSAKRSSQGKNVSSLSSLSSGLFSDADISKEQMSLEVSPDPDPVHIVQERTDDERNSLIQNLTLSPSGEKNTFKMFRHMMAEQYGYKPHDFEDLAPLSIPLQAGGDGIAPVTDIWLISPHLDTLDKVRTVVHEFAKSIGAWAGFLVYHEPEKLDVGYELEPLSNAPTRRAQITWQLLASLLGDVNPEYPNDASIYAELLGTIDSADNWPDLILVRFFRLIRLVRYARKLLDENKV